MSTHNAEHMQRAILAEGLTVMRGGQPILEGVSFGVRPGRLTGLIGPSGSGKTTLMRAIVGAQKITSGSLQILGQPAGSAQLRRDIGYVTQAPAIYRDLTARENLRYFATVLGRSNHDVRRAITQVDLAAQADQLVGLMSGGECARVSLAVALLGEPQVLVLDEPTVGLDPILRRHLWSLFRELAAAGRTLFISSHVMDEAERCDDLLLLREGRLLSFGPKHELLQNTGASAVETAFITLVERETPHAS